MILCVSVRQDPFMIKREANKLATAREYRYLYNTGECNGYMSC